MKKKILYCFIGLLLFSTGAYALFDVVAAVDSVTVSPSRVVTNGTITVSFTPQYVDMNGTNVMTNATISATFVPQDVSSTVVVTIQRP